MRTSISTALLILSAGCATTQNVESDTAAMTIAPSDAELARLAEANMREMLDAPGSPQTKSFNDRTVMLTADLSYTIGHSGITIIVPKGFVTDFASIPREFWLFLPPIGTYSRAAIIHDWLYWVQVCTRNQSDNLLLIAMKESGVSVGSQFFIYRAVRLFGQSAWDGNATERRQGFVRLVAPPFDTYPSNTKWDDYRNMLRLQHTADIPNPADVSFCRLGDGVDIS